MFKQFCGKRAAQGWKVDGKLQKVLAWYKVFSSAAKCGPSPRFALNFGTVWEFRLNVFEAQPC